MDYITLKEASQKWNVTPRQINYLCTSGRIPGAVKMATIWLVVQHIRNRLRHGSAAPKAFPVYEHDEQ